MDDQRVRAGLVHDLEIFCRRRVQRGVEEVHEQLLVFGIHVAQFRIRLVGFPEVNIFDVNLGEF